MTDSLRHRYEEAQVSENPRCEWTPEQIAPTYADQRAHDVFWMTAEERNTLDRRQSIPTVCPKR